VDIVPRAPVLKLQPANRRNDRTCVEGTTGSLPENASQRLAVELRPCQRAGQKSGRAQKLEVIGRLAAGVAHDFNNLLAVVMAGLNMLERTADPTKRELIVSGMRRAVARGEELTCQLLAFSRRMTLSLKPTDLRALLDGMRILLSAALRGDIIVDIRIPDDLWTVTVDPTQLELTILNAAVNAQDAMPAGGNLTIEASNTQLDGTANNALVGEFVRIEVRDTGTGIPPENLDRVFEPFFTTKEADKGTGLGLSQIHAFAERSHGHVTVMSRPSEGTSIILHLPSTFAASDGARSAVPVENNDQVAGKTL
jgi:signal transduction histidine kinase